MTRRTTRTAALAAVAATIALVLSACAPPAGGTSGGTPSNGGTLTVAATGSSKDSLDPNVNSGSIIDLIRGQQLFDNLTVYSRENKLQYALATSMDSNADATQWTIHLRKNVKTHSGKDFGADDVVFTINRIIAADSKANAKSLLSFIDPAGLKKIDDHTVQVALTKPYAPFPELWTNKYLPMVPVGFDATHPDGTGPFVYQSFSPGQSSTFSRNDDYWRTKAHVQTLKIIDFADQDAAINALKGGQVDIVSDVPLAEASTLSKTTGVNILDSKSSSYINIAMNTQAPPFNEPKVREAFRLIADRQQLVDNALSGYGVVGNDYIGGTTTCVPDVPQRKQDIAKAKQLLQESGHAGLTVTLATTNGTPGMVESAQVFAEQAKKAGVTVEVKNLDVASYLDNYLKWDFAVDFFSDDYLALAARTLLPGGSSFETHWDNPQFQKLAEKAFSTVDANARCDLEKQMKTVEYNEGANIIWGYYDTVNAYSDRVHGLKTDVTGWAVRRLADVWVTR